MSKCIDCGEKLTEDWEKEVGMCDTCTEYNNHHDALGSAMGDFQ